MYTQFFAFDDFSPPGLVSDNRNDDDWNFRIEGCGRGAVHRLWPFYNIVSGYLDIPDHGSVITW